MEVAVSVYVSMSECMSVSESTSVCESVSVSIFGCVSSRGSGWVCFCVCV